MSYPLICEGETIGAIAICSPDVKFFSDDRLWFFDVYSQLAAFALNNNRLTASFQEEKAERIRTEQCWRATNDELEERVRRRTAQLEEANEELEAFSLFCFARSQGSAVGGKISYRTIGGRGFSLQRDGIENSARGNTREYLQNVKPH